MPRALIVGGSGCECPSIAYPAQRLLEAGFEVHAASAPGLEPLDPGRLEPPYDFAVVAACDSPDERGLEAAETARIIVYSRPPGGEEPEPVLVEKHEGRVVVKARGPWSLYLAFREAMRWAREMGMLRDTPTRPSRGEVEEEARRLRLGK